MAISWRSELEIGVAEIDAQHKHLVESFNAFLHACHEGNGTSDLFGLLEFLDDYIVSHFCYEEALQTKLSYPDHDSHRLQHLGFIKRLQELKKQLPGEETPEVHHLIATNSLLLDWLIKHIAGADKQFGNYLAKIDYFQTV